VAYALFLAAEERMQPELIQQMLIEKLILLQNDRRKLSRKVNRHRQELLRILLAGGSVEPGVHIAEIQETRHDGRRIQKLKVR
jgi:hypothetical protein